MAEAIPVLQIIHVSDLHFRHPDYSDLADLAREGRMVRLQIRKLIEKRDWFGWHEGTLDHDECADRAFLEFLRDLRAIDGIWFPDEDDKANPPTWLVDTGDGTASGDDASMRLVQDRLRDWEATLLGCQLRTLYGNHDAWPGIQPALRGGMDHRRLADVQRTRVEEWPCWRSEKWRDPFVAP
ncbi:MAG TPA: hypothetical protein PKA20_19165, partial [Burkholderiaceae bacterium]|nr:hypothetical protein [Burkholderiaceae bacterium]